MNHEYLHCILWALNMQLSLVNLTHFKNTVPILTTVGIQKNFKNIRKYVFISLFTQFLMIYEVPTICADIDELSFAGVYNQINSDFFLSKW